MIIPKTVKELRLFAERIIADIDAERDRENKDKARNALTRKMWKLSAAMFGREQRTPTEDEVSAEANNFESEKYDYQRKTLHSFLAATISTDGAYTINLTVAELQTFGY